MRWSVANIPMLYINQCSTLYFVLGALHFLVYGSVSSEVDYKVQSSKHKVLNTVLGALHFLVYRSVFGKVDYKVQSSKHKVLSTNCGPLTTDYRQFFNGI